MSAGEWCKIYSSKLAGLKALATRQSWSPDASVSAGTAAGIPVAVLPAPSVEQTANDQASVHRELMRLPGLHLLTDPQ